MSQKTQKISIANFLGYRANLDAPDNVIEIMLESNGDKKAYHTASVLKFKKNDDGEFSLEVKGIENSLAVKPMIYTQDTLFLESNISIKQKIKEYFSDTGANDVCVIKMFNGSVYIGKSNTDFSVFSERLNQKEEPIQSSETAQKKELKAYETPTNMFQIYFSLFQKATLDERIKDVAKTIRKKISKVDEVKEHFLFKKENFQIEQEMLIKFVLEGYYNTTKQKQNETESESSNLKQMQKLVEKFASEEVDEIKKAKSEMFPYKRIDKIFDRKPFRMPILDLQAGSGESVFKTAKMAGISINLIGTEFRSMEELKNKDELSDNRNYNVITNVDTSMHIDDYSVLFSNITLSKAVENTTVYQSLPYTKNNALAEESVNILKHNQNIFGLYPTSMESFLKENINGFIFNVPKTLTGYTGRSIPDNLLFVIGSRHNEEQVEEQIQNRKENGLTILDTNIDTRAKNKFVVISDTDIKLATKTIQNEMSRSQGVLYNFKSRMNSSYIYQNSRDGDSVLVTPLGRYINETDNKIKNIVEISNTIENKKEVIIKSLNSNDTLRKEKIFPDYRNYNPNRDYKKTTYSNVLLDRGLLVFYRDKYPEIYKIIESLALEDGVELGLGKPTHSNYSLSSPEKPAKKDIVATESLGLMKLAYYPSSFSLETKEDKNALISLIVDIYKSKGSEISDNIKDTISSLAFDSSRLIIKTEDKISADLELKREEVFVFIDEDGLDIAKLNISLTDFYNSMNNLNMFDINDYVEKAELSDDKKEIIFSNFIKHLENLTYIIDENRDKEANPKKLTEQSIESIKKIKSLKDDKSLDAPTLESEQLSVYKEFAETNNMFEYYASFLKQTKADKILPKVFAKNAIFDNVGEKLLNSELTKISNFFEEAPISFYEKYRAKSDSLIRESFKVLSKNSNLSEEALVESENNFAIDVYEQLSEEYEVRKSISESAIKTAKLFILNKTLIDIYKNKGYKNSKLYDMFFENIMTNTFGLMAHQFKNPERFIEISDDKKVDIINWEMRSGKTLAFLNEMYLLMLYKGLDASLMLETKTMNDIVSQMMRHLPLMMTNINFNMPKTTADVTILDTNNVYEFFAEGTEIFANIPKILNPFFIKKGVGQVEELKRFGFEFEELLSEIKNKGISMETIKKEHNGSKFLPLLENAC